MRFWARSRGLAVIVLSCLALVVLPQTQKKPNIANKTPLRANELTLAGLRPGVDTFARALRLYPVRKDVPKQADDQANYSNSCRHETLAIDFDSSHHVQVIRVGWLADSEGTNCEPPPPPTPWKTGLGLRIRDSTRTVVQLYGEPDSKSPSSKGGQQLELWYYAFDWAGADVPQVMEVLCTKEKDGLPGRVVEITLAAPSL
jgi:hypothetical protein